MRFTGLFKMVLKTLKTFLIYPEVIRSFILVDVSTSCITLLQ